MKNLCLALLASPVLVFLCSPGRCDAGAADLQATSSAEQLEQDVDTQKLIRLVVGATKPKDMATALRSLFRDADSAKLALLSQHPHDGMAIRAAWEEVISDLPKEEHRPPISLDERRLHRFLGFVEGRLAVRVPDWWEKYLLRARAHHGKDVVSSSLKMQSPYEIIEPWFQANRGTRLEKNANSVIIKRGRESLALTVSQFEDLGPGADSLSAIFKDNRCYVAMHFHSPAPYKLRCIERLSGRVIWESEVWAEGEARSYTGPGIHHFVTIQRTGDRMVLFGVGEGRVYIEAFNDKDGKCLFRFSTWNR